MSKSDNNAKVIKRECMFQSQMFGNSVHEGKLAKMVVAGFFLLIEMMARIS